MASETTVAAAGSPSTLAGVGTAIKGFAIAHPVGLSVAGGLLLGVGAYYAVARFLSKRKADSGEQEAAPEEGAPAAA
jgi:hypothetical protein